MSKRIIGVRVREGQHECHRNEWCRKSEKVRDIWVKIVEGGFLEGGKI